MPLELRYYQRDACDAPYAYWEKKPEGNPLIVIPTGGGKALILCTITQEFIEIELTTRVLMATHVKELVAQNYAELKGMWPFAPAGIYSASLKRREASAQILFGGIQSMFRHAQRIGHVDVLMIDEAQLVPPDEAAMYQKFIKALREINPKMLILGLTATPYRIDSGMLTEGDDALFDDIIYEISISELIDKGYLCPLVTKATTTVIDMKGVGRSKGDFKPGQLQLAADKHPITAGAVDEIIAYASSNEEPRRSWLAFCTGVDHALHVRDEIRSRGYSCEAITGDTDPDDRDRWIEDFKKGKITALTNANVLTTGFNAPGVDLIAMLRPTDSTALYVQMVGRGTRCIGKDIEASIANGKRNCLVLDFAGNIRRHGPVDRVTVRKPGKGGGEAPVKECPNCRSMIFAGLSDCPDCGHHFERDVEKNIVKSATADVIIAGGKTANVLTWVPVTERRLYRHEKPGGTPSIRVEYRCGMVVHKEWICPEHKGYARILFEKWWKKHGGGDDAPNTITESFAAAPKLFQCAEIAIKPNGKHWEIAGHKLAEADESKPAVGIGPVQLSRDEMIARNYELNGNQAAADNYRKAVAERNAAKQAPAAVAMPGRNNLAAAKATMPGRRVARASVTQLATNNGFSPWEEMQKRVAREERAAKASKPWNAQITPPITEDDVPF
jgi:DNA repair protein RadD